MNEIKKECLEPEKEVSTEELEEKEKILRLAEAWSDEELNQHFSETIQETPGFDPEKELEEIKNQVRRAPVHEQKRLKRELVAEFKREFINQRQGIAELMVELENSIRRNPDTAKDELLDLVSKEAPVYQLNQYQIEQFRKAIEIYCQKHQTIQKYVRYHQDRFKENWQKEFFRNLFGEYPVGQIDLKVGPITLCWFFREPKDGALILDMPEKLIPNAKGIKSLNPSKLPGIEGTINAVNLKAFEKYEETGETEKHEESHSIDELFFAVDFSGIGKKLEELKEKHFRKMGDKKNIEVVTLIEEFISRSVMEMRRLFQKFIKSEILARLKAGSRQVSDILTPDIAEEKLLERTVYDYFKKKFFDEKDLSEALVNLVEINLGRAYRKKTLETVKKAIVQEKEFYKYNVRDALAALRYLAKIHPYDYDRNKLAALLSVESLAKWPRLAIMFKEIENK